MIHLVSSLEVGLKVMSTYTNTLYKKGVFLHNRLYHRVAEAITYDYKCFTEYT